MYWDGDIKKDMPIRDIFMSSTPHGFSEAESQSGEMGYSVITPSLRGSRFIPGQKKDQVKISVLPQGRRFEKKIQCKSNFLDKQFETPPSSRSNSPQSESSFTTLFLSERGKLNSSPPSSPSLCPFRSGSLRLGNGALPTSGILDLPT